MELVEYIIDLDPKMRFAAIVDLKGNIVEAIMKTGKTLKLKKKKNIFASKLLKDEKCERNLINT